MIALYQFGIVTTLEASKYIEQANSLIQTGSYTSGNFHLYSTQIVLIAACFWIGSGLWPVVLLQLTASGFSLFLFYKMAIHFTKRTSIALIASLLLAIMFYYQVYNVYLYTESLFFSLSIFFTYHLFTAQKPTAKFWIGTLILLLLLIFTRPTGILFILPTSVFLIRRYMPEKAVFLIFLFLCTSIIGYYFVLNASLNAGGELDFLLPYNEEHVICGVPGITGSNNIKVPVNHNSVAGLYYILINNFELVTRLMKQRFFAFWSVQRPFYSTAHNILVAVYFYPLYVAIILGLWKMIQKRTAEALFLCLYIFLTMTTVLFSCDEWHSRFLYATLPFLLLLGCGIFVTPDRQTNLES